MSIVSFAAAKAEREPHWAGPCQCIECQHEWFGTAPMGVLWIECPSCELPKGHPKYPFGGQVGDAVFECKCGSEALTAYKRQGRFYLRCMACGVDHTMAVWA